MVKWEHMWRAPQKQTGFTIVELLIVIVVIAILAAITIVAYNGIQNRAKAAAAQSAASQAVKKMAAQAVLDGDVYPENEAAFLASIGAQTSGVTYQYRASADRKSYCLTTTSNNMSYVTTNAAPTPTAGACDGHSLDGGTVTINRSNNPSLELGTAGLGLMGGTGTDSSAGRSNAWSVDGTFSYHVTKTVVTGAAKGVKVNLPDELVVGDVVRWAATVRNSASSVAARQFKAYGERGSPSYVGYDGSGWTSISPTQSARITGQVTITSANIAAAGTSGFGVLPNSNPAFEINDAYFIDGFVITINQPLPSGYVDGDSSGWVWDGSPDASQSRGR